ncbi:hypothetical protein [Dyella flagellata]|uniref:Uncharacterized protein n=1 Tax=Dyella flagellata TaxID=1867833 RepID=A0ABQ5XFX1_9GAMM|nr:hypothetical protein [Dyella flagellata]GLQ90237.1 hypothetical protein GCM10007898_38120 [Dyella flagellata]
MKISSTLAPLAVCAVRDAVSFHERLLQSETLRNRSDYEAYAVDLSVFLDEIAYQYQKIEARLGLPLDDFFDSDIPVLAYSSKSAPSPAEGKGISVSDPHALLMVSSVRDAILYRESLLPGETSPEKIRDQQEYLAQLAKLMEYVKDEYRKIESEVGVPLERILHTT